MEGALAETERFGSQELAALQGATGKPFTHLVEIAKPKALQLSLRRLRQHLLGAANEFADVELSAFHLLIQRRALLNQQTRNQDHRQYRNDQAHRQGDDRRQVSPVPHAT